MMPTKRILAALQERKCNPRPTGRGCAMPNSAPVPETVAPELLTLRQAAELCGVSERTLWSWARSGIAPPALRIGKGTTRYARTAYLAWIAGGCKPVGDQEAGGP